MIFIFLAKKNKKLKDINKKLYEYVVGCVGNGTNKWARMDKRGSHEKLNIALVKFIPPGDFDMLIYKFGVQKKSLIIII